MCLGKGTFSFICRGLHFVLIQFFAFHHYFLFRPSAPVNTKYKLTWNSQTPDYPIIIVVDKLHFAATSPTIICLPVVWKFCIGSHMISVFCHFQVGLDLHGDSLFTRDFFILSFLFYSLFS
jgi:hypothetical protein